ncbi:MAG: hypothetical protein LBG15_15930 [Dysgonamonadaceae bacterium]|nr:hypothetical protein [Dysgonamonadaceae bacterium]
MTFKLGNKVVKTTVQYSGSVNVVFIRVITSFERALTAPSTLMRFFPAEALTNILAIDRTLQIKGARTKWAASHYQNILLNRFLMSNVLICIIYLTLTFDYIV